MKSKVKMLVLALAGLASLGVASGAFAACDNTSLSAWSGSSVGGGDSAILVVPGGYDGSACKLQINLGNNGAGHGQVRDDSPQNETRYRAQFIFDPVNLNGANGTSQSAIFLANSAAVHDNRLALVKMIYSGSGGGSKRVVIIAACENAATQNQCQTAVDLPNQTGPNRIEIDLTVGASGVGALRYWVNDAATTGLLDANGIAIPITGGNAGWVGVKTVFLGMTSPSLNFRSVAVGQRRQAGFLRPVRFAPSDIYRTLMTFVGH